MIGRLWRSCARLPPAMVWAAGRTAWRQVREMSADLMIRGDQRVGHAASKSALNMSAVPPIAPELVCRNELTRCARFCSLIPGFGVKLSAVILAGPTVLSAVGACPPHDGV